MYFITGGVGFLACVILMILIIMRAVKDKSCVTLLIAFFLAAALFLGSGFLYSRTDPHIGGTEFLSTLLRDKTVPPNLTGEWWAPDASNKDAYHGIYISGNHIEIYWISDGGATQTLYWEGTYDAPTDGKEPYTWESYSDPSHASGLLAAAGSTKEFTYENGVISYSASALGMTTTIEAKKQSWGFSPESEDTGTAALSSTVPVADADAEAELTGLIEADAIVKYDGYTIDFDDSAVTVSVWKESITRTAALIQENNGSAEDADWVSLKAVTENSVAYICDCIRSSALSGLDLVFQVLDDADHSRALLTFTNTDVTYDILAV
ncbi:MAG: hypothetical protein HDT14_10275 [Oscillibacter sp.]|nr:hypothetical protein [Oscillibacter sp.]